MPRKKEKQALSKGAERFYSRFQAATGLQAGTARGIASAPATSPALAAEGSDDAASREEASRRSGVVATSGSSPSPTDADGRRAFPLSELSAAHPRRRFGWDRPARVAVIARTELVPETNPLMLLRKLFYAMLEFAHGAGWQWTPMQDRAAALLDARDGKTAGSSMAFARCFRELAMTLGAGFDEDDVRVVTFGDDCPWISVPYHGSGVDKHFMGNLVSGEKLTRQVVLAKHSFVWVPRGALDGACSEGHIFDPSFGIETSAFKRKAGWRGHADNIVHSRFDADKPYVQKGLRGATQVGIAPRLAQRTFATYDWSPREWKAGSKAVAELGIVEPDVEDAKGFLRMTYPGTRFAEEEELRTKRVGTAGWFLWHTHPDGHRLEALEREAEAERRRVEAKRLARIARLREQRRQEQLAMGGQ